MIKEKGIEVRRGLFFNKRGEDVVISPVVFLIISIIVFSALLGFVYRSSSGALIYEQAYAKEIGLLIDKAKPGTEIYFNFDKGYEIAKKNNFPVPNTIIIDNENNIVKVSLASGGGYSYKFFSKNNADKDFKEVDNQILLIIK